MALCGSGWSECDEEEEYGFSHGYLKIWSQNGNLRSKLSSSRVWAGLAGPGGVLRADTPCSSLSDGFCNHAQSPRQSDIYLSTDHSPLFTQPHITHVAQEEDCTRAHMADACIHHCQ